MAKKSIIWSVLLATALLTACNGDEPAPCVDNDQDGFYTDDGVCVDTVYDCDDFDADINPRAIDDTCDDVDEDCDPTTSVPGSDECFECTEAGDTLEDACEIELVDSTWVYHDDAIQEAGDRDFLTIEAEAGTWYILWAERRGTDPGSPDTVLRVYDGQGTEIAENDDMPYRMKDTDAAHMFQAVRDETIGIEVLEWSDWAEDGPVGDSSYVYRTGIWSGPIDEANENNDTAVDVAAYEDGGQWQGMPFKEGWPYWAPGVIDPAGDVDVYPVDFLSEDSLCQFGFWPDSPSLLSPKLDVYWEDCTPSSDTDPGDCDGLGLELIASTTSPETTPTGTFISEDAGVTAYIPSGAYYAEVSDTDGAGGVGYFYNLMTSCYLTDWFEHELEDGNNSRLSNTPVTMDDTNGDGRYFGTFFGQRQVLSEGSDDMDTYRVANALGNGKYFTVNLEAENVGSLVGDLKMTFWEKVGDNFNELATVTSDNPRIRDYQLANETAIYVTIEPQGDYQGLASQYFGTVIISDDLVYPPE